MYIPGHIAIGYLIVAGPALARRVHINPTTALFPALLGTLTPDIIDKTLQLTPFTPFGRTIAHSLLVFASLILLWKLATLLRLLRPGGATIVGWWLAGYGSHLIVDLINDLFRGLEHTGYLFSAWIGWPFTNPDMHQLQWPVENPCQHCYSSLEIGLLAMTLAVAITHTLQLKQGTLQLPGSTEK